MKAKLVFGIIFSKEDDYSKTVKILTGLYGDIAKVSQKYSFSQFTDYYEPELGKELYRLFILFKNPIDAEQIADIKLKAIELEKKLSKSGKRIVNLDPGYVTSDQFVLASTKQSSNKVYLAKGIWAQLIYQIGKNKCNENERTFPDLRQDTVKKFILECAATSL
jgi:hypothetical protein